MPLSRDDLGRRIAAAREHKGLTQAALGRAVDIGQSAVSRIESGERGVDSLELAAIADALDTTVVDLLETRPLAAELRVAARQQDVADSSALERAIDRVVDVMRLNEMLDELGLRAESPQVALVHAAAQGLAIDQGRALAEQLRETWDLGDDPLPDLFSLIEDRAGVAILLEPLSGGLDGLFARIGDAPVIVVDSSVVLGRQRFTACHELCHFLLGEGELVIVDERIFLRGDPGETRANAFAAHFLMPAEGVDRYVRGRPIDEPVVTELQYTFGVSLDSVLWHLLNLGLIAEERREELSQRGARGLAYRWGYASEWERQESERDTRRPPRSLVMRALTAYERGLISVKVVAALMGRDDPEALRGELESVGIGHDSSWWELTAPP